MTHLEYEQILSRCGAFEVLPDKERWKLMQAWREAYARALHTLTGKWSRDGFDWHVFSFEHTPASSGTRALEAYRAERPEVLIVIPQFKKFPAVRLHVQVLPEFPRTDVYVFPENLSWTLAFTHEQSSGLGPYFSRQPVGAPDAQDV